MTHEKSSAQIEHTQRNADAWNQYLDECRAAGLLANAARLDALACARDRVIDAYRQARVACDFALPCNVCGRWK